MSTSKNSNRNQNVTDQRHPHSKRGPYGKTTLEKRTKIIDQVLQEGYSPSEAAKENRVAISTVNTMADVFIKEGRYDAKKEDDLLDDDNVQTLQDLQKKVLEGFDVKLSISGIHLHLICEIHSP
ncbi:hypothetical protein BD408DRAFT_448857 [Parasitella parasitica]|nr:hypothetical protein BD408DRAFT_448857 [Parasitella parasitica]